MSALETVAWRWRWAQTRDWRYRDYNAHPEADENEPLTPLAPAQAEIERLNARVAELHMLAHGWMVAHDMLAGGLPYAFPRPLDLPESEARALAAEERVKVLSEALGKAKSFVDDLTAALAALQQKEVE